MTGPSHTRAEGGAKASGPHADRDAGGVLGGHDHRAVAPRVAQLGGTFAFSDTAGREIAQADFRGRWTLLFFGYSRCRASCPIAIPKIVRTAALLRQSGIAARAMFVDIDVPPLGIMRFRRPGAAAAMAGHAGHEHGHGHGHGELDRVAAMRALAKAYDGKLIVATGTRAQLSAATRAFSVAREHIPPRPGELGHSINHSSLIYFLAPDTRVAGYGMHDQSVTDLEQAVRRMARLT